MTSAQNVPYVTAQSDAEREERERQRLAQKAAEDMRELSERCFYYGAFDEED